MASLTLEDLKREFSVNPQDASGFLLLLAKLEVGDELVTPCMRIVKLEDEKLQLLLLENDIETMVQDLADSTVDPLMAMMGSDDD